MVKSSNAETVMRVGSTPTGVPFTFLNTENGKIDGMMIDLIEKIGSALHFKVKIMPMGFSSLVPALEANKIDIIAAAMSRTPKRAKVVDFSNDIYSYGEGLFVPANDAKKYASIQDMKGYTVGAQIGTNYLEMLQKSGVFAKVRSYDNIPDIISDVAAKRIQAGFGDGPILAYLFSHHTYSKVRLVKGYKPYVVGSINIGVKKGNTELVSKIDATLKKFKSDGTLQKILDKWHLPPSAK